jgi:Holliday junction resolvase RusA-like endonuclease
MLTIVVHGAPATQGSFKAVISKSTGRPMVKKANEKSQNSWRANVRDEAKRVMGGRDPMAGPVVMTITLTRFKPASEPKRKPSWPWQKPDWDKYARAICDGLKDGGVYKDDAQVLKAWFSKNYPVTGDDRLPIYMESANFMLEVAVSWKPWDVLNTPGVVIRVAHLSEFDGIREKLAGLGYGPADIPGWEEAFSA